MKNKILCSTILFIILSLACSNVFAATLKSSEATMELVEKNMCELNLNEKGIFTKELTNFDSKNKEVTLTLTVKNTMKSEDASSPVEIFFVLDNSHSMSVNYDGKTKMQHVTETANSLISKLFDHFENIKIGLVSFSSVDPVANPDAILGTTADAKLLLPLSNSESTVKSAIDTYSSSEGPYTNIEAGLNIAQTNFTSSTNSKKYIILLSDGVPNVSLDTSKTLTYSGTNATNTKNKLKDISNSGYYIFSVLTNASDTAVECPMAPILEDTSKHMTYGELTQEIFGTPENPTVGSFYHIDYEDLYSVINESIYGKITSKTDSTLKNLVIKDYFPSEIIENFNFEYVKSPNIGTVSEKIDTTENSITWEIEVLKEGEVATLSYKLILKDEYNEEIANKILQTNYKVNIDYKYGEDSKNVYSDSEKDFSKIKIIPDKTVAEDPIPQTGNYNLSIALFGILILAIAVIRVKIKLHNNS